MNDRDQGHLEDTLSYALDAIELLGGATATGLASDKMRRYAVTRAVEVVGEAASRVSEEGKATLPQLPWREAIGMRNVLIHGYAGLDLSILTDTVRRNFPKLIEDLRQVLGESSS